MVHKRCRTQNSYRHRFENDVKMYGTQANARQNAYNATFENDVKMYGTQAEKCIEWLRG